MDGDLGELGLVDAVRRRRHVEVVEQDAAALVARYPDVHLKVALESNVAWEYYILVLSNSLSRLSNPPNQRSMQEMKSATGPLRNLHPSSEFERLCADEGRIRAS